MPSEVDDRLITRELGRSYHSTCSGRGRMTAKLRREDYESFDMMVLHYNKCNNVTGRGEDVRG